MLLIYVARRGAHLAAERSPSGARADGARRSVAVPNGEGEASGSATLIAKNFKKAISLAKAPSHEKHFSTLDVRGLWHARPLPSILPITSHGLRPRTLSKFHLENNISSITSSCSDRWSSG